MSVDNIIKYPKQDYHSLVSGAAHPSGVANGAIIRMKDALNRQTCQTVSIESTYGTTTIRLNVVEDVYGRQDRDNNWIMNAGFWTQPLILDTIEHEKDDITIPSGMTWSMNKEIAIGDIKVVEIANGNKITFS